ncbi:hypothetical protein [Pseudomonas sp. NA-150]|uniref:hypothetical protein n=1 Tax=Pseudomonas sp. NA-150 TaxID=3367525 RepID=UPI0037C85191
MNGIIEIIVQLIASASVSALLTTALIWLSKSLITERLKNAIKNEYDQKLETHKAQLKAQSEIEIEKLRAQLNITATEHEVRFSRLHEKRAEVLAETYSLLRELLATLSNYVKLFESAGDIPKAQRRDATVDALNNFRNFYAKRLVFIPKETAKKLETLDRNFIKIYNEFLYTVELIPNKDNNTYQNWVNIFDRVNTEARDALLELEDEFRKLLGDES